MELITLLVQPEYAKYSLVLLIPLIIQAIRPKLEKHHIGSTVLPWIVLIISYVGVIPFLIWSKPDTGWRILFGAFAEGLPIGITAIALYDLGGKPIKKYIRKWKEIKKVIDKRVGGTDA